MNVLIVSHAAWRHTGYGAPIVPFVRELRKYGHNAAVLAVEERGPGQLEYAGIRHYLPCQSPYGEDVAATVVKDFQADVVISLLDAWVFSPGDHFGGCPWLAWTPVDQDPPWARMLDNLKLAKSAYSFSQWGGEVLKRHVLNAGSITLGIDTQVFKPASYEARLQKRQAVGLDENAFIVGMVGTNLATDRKALKESIAGFSKFADTYPGARLLLWTNLHGGVSLGEYIDEIDGEQGRVSLANQWQVAYGASPQTLASFYNSLDVLLNPSAAEGFGLPILEAMACGTPVIGAANTSMPELITERVGWLVTETTPEWTKFNGWRHRPTVQSIADALAKAHDDLKSVGSPRPYLEDCQGWAQGYDWDYVGSLWYEVLRAL